MGRLVHDSKEPGGEKGGIMTKADLERLVQALGQRIESALESKRAKVTPE